MTPAPADNWIVHPSRFESWHDRPGDDGGCTPAMVSQQPVPEPFRARVRLSRNLSHLGSDDGTVTFAGSDWWFVVGAARTFVATHTGLEVPRPFGFRRRGRWQWWDGSTSDSSIAVGHAETEHVRHYLNRLFPTCSIDLHAP